jgi:hypothetical protein
MCGHEAQMGLDTKTNWPTTVGRNVTLTVGTKNHCAGEDQQQFSSQSEFSSTRARTAEGSNYWSQQSQYEVGVRWSLACKDVSLEAEERPPLETVTKQHDWEH